MLVKLATHDIQDVAELFSLADKYARAAGRHAWHTPRTLEVGKEGKLDAGIIAQDSGNKNKNKNNSKKKAGGNNQPLAGAPTVVAVAAGGGRGPRGDKYPHQASDNNDGGT
jgi:hypothetical protein